jgi:hypothetical protein
VAAGESPGKENVTSTLPSLYGRPEGTLVALTDTGAFGSKKSFADWLILPACFDIIFSFNFY